MNDYKTTKLSNGITVVTENIPHVHSFSLGFWVNTGSINENSGNNGISHFIEHMLFKGTKSRTAKKIADEIESLGGYLNAFTSKEHTCYYGRGLSRHVEKTFEVLSDMIQNSLFRAKDIKKEAGVIVDELLDIEDSPEELIFDKFESNIYRGNSVHYPIIGTLNNIRRFDKSDISEYMKKHYVLNNLYVVASGAVDHDKIVLLTEKYIQKNLGTKRRSKKTLKLKKVDDIFIRKETQQTHVIIGRSTYGSNSKKRTAVSVLSHILGEGSSSRLFQSLRERNGITYQINTFLNSFYNISTFGIYFSTNKNSAEKALELVYEELEKMAEKQVTKRELKRAKEYIKGNIIMSLENTTNRMLRIAQSMIYFNKIKLLEESVAEIDTLEIDELFDLSQKLFDKKHFSKAIITSADDLANSPLVT